MKEKLLNFLHGLISYDYILFGASFTVFILFIILALLLRKRLVFAILFFFLGFGVLLLGPTLGYVQIHKYLFKNSVKITSLKKLNFVKAVVVKGTITNESRFVLRECKVTAEIHKVSKNEYKNYILRLKPFIKRSIVIKDILKGDQKEFKIIIEPFKYPNDYNLSVEAFCK